MSYFHTGIRTIIGAESFHGPVRDGKVWFQLAMVIRQKGLPRWFWVSAANREEEFRTRFLDFVFRSCLS